VRERRAKGTALLLDRPPVAYLEFGLSEGGGIESNGDVDFSSNKMNSGRGGPTNVCF